MKFNLLAFARSAALIPMLTSLALAAPASARKGDKDLVRAHAPPVVLSGERWALLIGVDDYEDPAISDLTVTDDDARAIAKVLIESGAFPAEHVIVMTRDQPDPLLRPTRANLLEQLARLQVLHDLDSLLIYYSGHGAAAGPELTDYIFPIDTRVNIPEQTGIKVDDLLLAADAVDAARRMVIFDACRNRLLNGAKALPTAWTEPRYVRTFGMQVLYGTRFGDYSYEEEDLGLSVMTSHLIAGLKGEADGATMQPPDGVISSEELYRYVFQQMEKVGTQIPTLAGEKEGLDFAVVPVNLDELQRCDVTNLRMKKLIEVANGAVGDSATFLVAQHRVSSAISCLSEPLEPELAAEIHRLQAIGSAWTKDANGAKLAFQAVSEVDRFNDYQVGLPPADEALLALARDGYAAERSDETPIEKTQGVYLLVDGRRSRKRPEDRPAILQAMELGETPQWSAYLWPQAPVPPIAPVGIDRETRMRRAGGALLIGSGAATLAAAGLWITALDHRATFYALQSAPEDSETWRSELVSERAIANRLGVAAQVGTGTALLLASGGASLRFEF